MPTCESGLAISPTAAEMYETEARGNLKGSAYFLNQGTNESGDRPLPRNRYNKKHLPPHFAIRHLRWERSISLGAFGEDFPPDTLGAHTLDDECRWN